MNIKIVLFSLLALFSIAILTGQVSGNGEYVSGEVLVQLKNEASLPDFLNKYNLTEKHHISQRFNIYLFSFDKLRTNNATLLSVLKSDDLVVHAQNNHHVSLRDSDQTVPDDEIFNEQWALLNTGQNGGIEGADTDATLAWDITTGGITALGDTIVIAIIDGGTDLNHEDLDFWKNRGEIPNNNIDDDNNGYIDDYDGWNAYNHSDDIPIHLHGVHVCGIAGAIGNNGVGVAGVNWNVKILPIAGDSYYESIVVEALSYIYVLRERYNMTNGAEGAFVVADNCSFGVNNGQPEDYPIWEAMYDSLGRIGVLSMGATANRNWNIDEVGDVPTAFTTDYMISVTNTMKTDIINPSAGWGDTTIDLAAPGTSIYSLGLNNNYQTKTGTSMSTPHVTGAVALLIAAADSAFIAGYKSNPAHGALEIKNYILNGVDTLPSLQGVTVTGGRLNLFKSINLMLGGIPSLTTNMDSANMSMPFYTTTHDTLIITNSGSDTLDYSIFIEEKPDWITLSQNEGSLLGGEQNSILITYGSPGLDTGNYYCTINIDAEEINGKTIPVNMYAYDNTGIEDVFSSSGVTVFPNPFKSSVEFSFDVEENGYAMIEIYNQYGNIVYVDQQKVLPGKVIFNWDDSSKGQGIFFYKIKINNQQLNPGKVFKL